MALNALMCAGGTVTARRGTWGVGDVAEVGSLGLRGGPQQLSCSTGPAPGGWLSLAPSIPLPQLRNTPTPPSWRQKWGEPPATADEGSSRVRDDKRTTGARQPKSVDLGEGQPPPKIISGQNRLFDERLIASLAHFPLDHFQ